MEPTVQIDFSSSVEDHSAQLCVYSTGMFNLKDFNTVASVADDYWTGQQSKSASRKSARELLHENMKQINK